MATDENAVRQKFNSSVSLATLQLLNCSRHNGQQIICGKSYDTVLNSRQGEDVVRALQAEERADPKAMGCKGGQCTGAWRVWLSHGGDAGAWHLPEAVAKSLRASEARPGLSSLSSEQ